MHKTRKAVLGEDEEKKLKRGEEKVKGKFKDAVEGRDRDRDRDRERERERERERGRDDRDRRLVEGDGDDRSHRRPNNRRGKSPDVMVIEERFRNGRPEARRVFDNGKLILEEGDRRYDNDHSSGGGRSSRDSERFMLEHRPSVARLRPGRYYEIDGGDGVLYEDRLVRRHPYG